MYVAASLWIIIPLLVM